MSRYSPLDDVEIWLIIATFFVILVTILVVFSFLGWT